MYDRTVELAFFVGCVTGLGWGLAVGGLYVWWVLA